MKYLLSLFTIFLSLNVLAQDCVYLAYDSFDNVPNTPLHGSTNGQTFKSGWSVQNQNVNTNGYTFSTATPLNYLDLKTENAYLSGGQEYLTVGRGFSLEPDGLFADYLNANGHIGANGKTLWVSALLRKEVNNTEPIFFEMHNSQTSWAIDGGSCRIGFGYYGVDSEVSGEARWTLQINGTQYPTSENVLIGESTLLVLKIEMNTTSTISLFVNPTNLGFEMGTATEIQTTNIPIDFSSMGLRLGNTPSNGSADEIRIADSYVCVTPDANVTVNLPPVAVPSLSANNGASPLAINFDGSSSFDPDGNLVSWEWNLGEGGNWEDGLMTNYTYMNPSMRIIQHRVTDDAGAQNTAFDTIRIFNDQGNFPCYSHLSVAQAAHCETGNGVLEVYFGSAEDQVVLRDENGTVIPPTQSSWFVSFGNLIGGAYEVTVEGANGCQDHFDIFLPVDSTTCTGWEPEDCFEKMGMNLTGFSDWSTERPMKNLMKHVRSEFLTYQGFNQVSVQVEVDLDMNRYPLEIPQMTSAGEVTVGWVVSANAQGATEANLQLGESYVVLYDGVGTLNITGAVENIQSNPGRLSFKVLDDNMDVIILHVVASELGNHVRNIRLLRAIHENDDLDAAPFYEGFLDKINPFTCLRFMDWGEINFHEAVSWAERRMPSVISYGEGSTGWEVFGEGVPYEVMIDLANQAQKDVWICVPHAADENYIRQMAQMFREDLNPNLKIYLEYSNEVWNWSFSQAHYNLETAPQGLSYGRAYAEKARNIFSLWMEEFADESDRIHRVLGLQATNNWLNANMLAHLDPSEWDYGSPTWYFGVDHSDPSLNASSSPEDLIVNAENSWLMYKEFFHTDYLNVQLYGKEVINYEGGQHFSQFQQTVYNQALFEAQNHPGMYDLYERVLDTIRTWGSKLPVAFNFVGGQNNIYVFGHLNDIDVSEPYLTNAVKYQALLDQICVIPTAVQNPLLPVLSHEVTMFPNPNNGTILLIESNHSIQTIQLFNHLGQEVIRMNGKQEQIDLSTLATGMYFVQFNLNEKEKITKKLIVIK